MKMFYYIAESSKGSLFTTTLIARHESYEAAAEYCKNTMRKWHEEGLNAFLTFSEDVRHNPELEETAKVVGVEALDSEYMVVHHYMIFATPSFMAGGEIG